MTQADLSQKLNVTDKAVSRWERGVGFPDIRLPDAALTPTLVEFMQHTEYHLKTYLFLLYLKKEVITLNMGLAMLLRFLVVLVIIAGIGAFLFLIDYLMRQLFIGNDRFCPHCHGKMVIEWVPEEADPWEYFWTTGRINLLGMTKKAVLRCENCWYERKSQKDSTKLTKP